MDRLLCDISAFKVYRTPPVLIELMTELDEHAASSSKVPRAMNSHFVKSLGKPVHILVRHQRERFHSSGVRVHCWTGGLPQGACIDLGGGLSVTSPLFTLLGMAARLSTYRLVMAMSEMCGSFSVYNPNAIYVPALQGACGGSGLSGGNGWQPVTDKQGNLTGLWKRPPLVTREELTSFAQQNAGRKGVKRFTQAARLAVEGAASPLEVQAALRLGLPRRWGGEGIGNIKLNARIPLSPHAQNIAKQEVCYADLLLEGAPGTRPTIVECQSKLIHDSREKALADGARLAALQSMGYTVIPVTYEQLVDQAAFESIVTYLSKELGLRMKLKSNAMKRKELELCRDLFYDWEKLAD